MKVVILCGGQGTRIRDVSTEIPKPMIPIGDLPVLWHLMKHYAAAGHKEYVLCLGYKGEVIRDFFMNYERYRRDCTVTLGSQIAIDYHTNHAESDWRITLAETGLKAMTGARLRKIRNYVQGERDFFLTYGDGLSDVDVNDVLAFHRKHGRILTVTGVRVPSRFGELVTDTDGFASGFTEKADTSAGRISGGFFVCRANIFDYLPTGDGVVFEQEPMRALVRDRQMMVYEHNGFWQCMDTYRDWQLLSELLEKGNAPWITWRT